MPDSADISDAGRKFRTAQTEAEADLPLSSLVSLLASIRIRAVALLLSPPKQLSGVFEHFDDHAKARDSSW